MLQRFAGDDRQLIEEAVKKMADALELWLKEDGDLNQVMQQFNTKPAKAKKRAAKEAEEKVAAEQEAADNAAAEKEEKNNEV